MITVKIVLFKEKKKILREIEKEMKGNVDYIIQGFLHPP